MSRSLSLDMRHAIFAPQTGRYPIFLITITHPDTVDIGRMSSDATERLSTDPLIYGTVSRSNNYFHTLVSRQLPDEQGTFKLEFENVNRDLIPLLRSVSTPAQVKIELVLSSDPDNVEVEWPSFDLTAANYDKGKIVVDLTLDAMTGEPFPSGSFGPAYFPTLF